MRLLRAFVAVALAGVGAACGQGVSEDPLAGDGTGASGALDSGGSSGSAGSSGEGGTSASSGGMGEPDVTGGTSAGGSASGGRSTGGASGAGGSGEPGCTPKQRAVDGECLLVEGEACDSHRDCASGNCVDDVCCSERCEGLCEQCDASGTCVASETDDNCDSVVCESDRCATRTPPAEGTCAGSGACAGCVVNYVRAGIPCGAGRQCDGAGACELTERGRVAAGEHHTCAINDDANVVCWGDNRFGQLGAVFERQRVGFDEQPHDVPNREIDFQHDVVQLAAGAQHTCALFDTGGVRCWGTMYDHPTFGRINSIWGTLQFVFVLGSEGLPPGAVGELHGYGFINPLLTGDVILAEKAERISAAPDGATICALLESGKISCWGLNYFGQLGLGYTAQPDLRYLEVFDSVDLGERAVEVRSAFAHTCALTESGRVYCWGDGLYGRLGSGQNGPRNAPGAPVEIGEPAVGLALGFDHVCVLLARGAVRCWGNNHEGQLGYGHTLAIGDDETPLEAASFPRPGGRPSLGGDVALGTDVGQIVTFPASSVQGSNGIWASSPTCALSKDKYVRCWGRNDVGQLGYGHNRAGATEHTPLELGEIQDSDRYVRLGGDILALADGGRCALRDEAGKPGSLYCWGLNDHGQVGVGLMGTAGDPLPSLMRRPIDLGPVHWW